MSTAGSAEASHLDADGRPRIIERRFVVEDGFGGVRLDHYLKRKIPRLSRTKLQEVIRRQLRRGSGGPLKPSAPVAVGEELVISIEAKPEPPCPRDFGIVYEDEHVMIIDKPAGLPVHASAKFYFNTLTRVLLERYPEAPPQICHRLDRETSGCLVLGKDKRSAARLQRAFEHKQARKAYLAIVYGAPAWDDTVIDLPLGLIDPDEGLDIRMVVRDDAAPAQTRVRVVERAAEHALVRCEPITGRQHQIRAHLAAVGHPIVGDKLYAHGDEAFMTFCDQGMTPELLATFRLPRHALHAASIALPHPATGAELRAEAPLPPDLRDFWAEVT